MSYAEELRQLTRALTDVAATGQHDLPDGDVPAALVARRSVLELLTTVHHDLAGLRPRHGVTTITDLEAHPVAALGRALLRHPRPPLKHAPTDAHLTSAETVVGRAWQRAGRHALVAHHHWTNGDGPTPGPATRWAGLADVAALCRQLAVLDVELADVLRPRPAWRGEARILVAAATSGLATASRETSRLAAAGPLTGPGPDRSALTAPSRRILIARTAADLPGTQQRLADFLDGAGHVLPQRIPQLATAIARCALLARDQLPAGDFGTRALRGELREHARLLQLATTTPGFAACLEPGDARPLRQAVEAYQGLARRTAALGADRRLLAGYVEQLAVTTRALGGAVDRSIRSGRWLVPDRSESLVEPTWKRLRPSAPAPYPVLAVRAAVKHSDALDQAAATWRQASAPAQIRQVLARASGQSTAAGTPPRDLIADTTPRRRPALPGQAAVSRSRTQLRR